MDRKFGKLLALVLALALCVCLLPSALAASAYKAGDINGDGAVKASDLVRLLKYLNNEPVELIGDGDVNGDGAVDLGDAIRLLKHLVDRDVTIHPTPEPTETPTETPADTWVGPTEADFIRYAQAGTRFFTWNGRECYVPWDIWNQYKPTTTGGGGTGGGTTTTPTPAPTATPHSHTWVTETVYHDEVGHWESVPKTRTVDNSYWVSNWVPGYYECFTCGFTGDLDTVGTHCASNEGHASYHLVAAHDEGYWVEDYATETYYVDEWAVDQAAWTETITKCSVCGATK